MKERTRNLFELAEADLKVANETVEPFPHIAAFHAQQCVEKALKAMVWELSDSINEDELRNKIKHDSIRAVTKVLALAINESMKRSDFRAIESKLRKNSKTTVNRLLLLLFMSATMTFENISKLFDTMPISKNKDYWGESLNPNLKPDPKFDREWMAQLERGGEFTNILLDFVMSPTEDPNVPSEVPTTAEERTKWAKDWLEKKKTDFVEKGQKLEAKSVEKSLKELDRLTNPDSSLVEWMKLVIFWTPYLDAHAIRARYVPFNELKKYQKHRGGVRNLIKVSNHVLDESKSVLLTLTT